MRKKAMLIFFCIILVAFSSFLYAYQTFSSQEIKWEKWADSNFLRAKEENRLILIYGKSQWCHWCKKMESTTFQDPILIKIINDSYIPVRIDIDTNTDVAAKLKIIDLPTVIILNANHEVINTFSGYFPPDVMIKKLKETNTGNQSISKKTNLSDFHIAIIGAKNNAQAKQLYNAANSYKNAKIEWLQKEDKSKIYPELKFPILNKSAAFICINNHCSFPIFNSNDFQKVIQQLSLSSKDFKKENITSINTAQGEAEDLLKNKNIFFIILGFWLFGLLLAFTPCVLPLILIIAAFLAGRTGEISKQKTICLSFTYVFSLSLTYAAAGVIAAMFGIYLQIYFQNRWILGLFGLLFFLLALSLLGFYKLELPESLRRYFVKFNKFQKNYTHFQVALMGVFATLIAFPCVAAPLVGVLSYISSSGNIILGGLALFTMGLGIGTPLLIASILGVNILPKKYQWQEVVKTFLGLLLIGISIWLLERVIAKSISMVLWSILVIFTAIYMGALKKNKKNNFFRFFKALSIMVLVYGIAIFIGALIGNTDPLNPLQITNLMNSNSLVKSSSFKSIHTLDEFQKSITFAKQTHKPVLLDFFAEWCVSCKEMESNVYNDEKVKLLLNKFVLLRVDLSDINAESKAVAERFNIIAPPATLFFEENGDEINIRIFNDISAEKFSDVLTNILKKDNQSM